MSPDHGYFNVNKTYHKVIVTVIRYIESLKDYVRIHTKGDRVGVKENFGTILKELPPSKFIRTHRSFAVPIDHRKSVDQNEVEVYGEKCLIGGSYRNDVMRILK